MEGVHRTPWTDAEAEALIAGVRRALLEAPKLINWDLVWERVQHALPARVLQPGAWPSLLPAMPARPVHQRDR